MKHKQYPIYIWFLDEDLQKSAEYLTDKALVKTIGGCIGAIISTYFYFIGIRSKKFYSYFFDKEHKTNTMIQFFPNWPLKKQPLFTAYGRKESKWCRMCRENFDYIKRYLQILFDEYLYRNSTEHDAVAFLQWVEFDMPKIDLSFARIGIIYLPWKVLNPRYRQANIIEGYRVQYMSTFETTNPFKEYGSCKRDIPEFVLNHFNADLMFDR